MGGGTPPPPTPTVAVPRVAYLGEFGAVDLVTPTRIAFTPEDELLVSDAQGRDVHVFTANGTPRATVGGFSRPLAVGPLPGTTRSEFYVGDAGDGSVRVVNRKGERLGVLGAGAGEFAMPNDLAADPVTGEVYVVDSRAHQVRVFAANGALLRAFLAHGTEPGQASFPTGILLDPAGRLHVIDHDNKRVQVFSTGGELAAGTLSGSFAFALGVVRPQGLARDALGRLYVADAYSGLIRVFDPNGAHLGDIGAADAGQGTLVIPSDVVLDRFGRLLVASYSTGKVVAYGIDDWTAPPPNPLDGASPPLGTAAGAAP